MDLDKLEAMQVAAALALPVIHDGIGTIHSKDNKFTLYDEGGANADQTDYVIALVNAAPELFSLIRKQESELKAAQAAPVAAMKPTHEQAMAGYEVACRYGILEGRAFKLVDDMFAAIFAVAHPLPAEQGAAPAAMKPMMYADTLGGVVVEVSAAPQQHAQASARSRVGGNDAQAALSADQIEELMPENEGNNGAFPCDKCGWIQVSAQWLHDFANNVYRAARQPAPSKTEGCAGFQGKDVADCGPCAGAGCDGAAPVAAAAQGDEPPLPETSYNGCGNGSEPLYTPEMMRDFYRQGRAAGIEEAAKLAETPGFGWIKEPGGHLRLQNKADVIRALNNQGG